MTKEELIKEKKLLLKDINYMKQMMRYGSDEYYEEQIKTNIAAIEDINEQLFLVS